MRALRWPSAAILLGAIAATLHAAALRGAFVWDDFDHVQAAAGALDLHEVFDPGRRFRPLLYLPGALDHVVWGTHAAGWHLTNLLLHGIVVALTLVVLRRLLPASPVATAAGTALFLLHPVASEPASWIMARGDSFSAALGLGAVIAAIASAGGRTRERMNLAAFAAGVLALGALLAKETGVMWLAIAPACAALAPLPPDRARRLAPTALGTVGAAACYLLLRARALPDTTAHAPTFAIREALLASGFYARQLLLPVFYDPCVESLPRGSVALVMGALAIGGSLAGFGLALRRDPRAALAIAWCWLAPLPSILTAAHPVSSTALADRHLYGSLPGLALGAALALSRLPVAAIARTPLRAAAAALAIALAFTSVRRDLAWRDETTLWQTVLARSPESRYARANLGIARLSAGDEASAMDAFRRGLASTEPGPFMRADLAAQLSMALAAAGRTREAAGALALAQGVPADAQGRAQLASARALLEIALGGVESPGWWQAYLRLEEIERHATEDPLFAWELARVLEAAGNRVDAAAIDRKVMTRGALTAPELAARASERARALDASIATERDPFRRALDAGRTAERAGHSQEAAAHYAEAAAFSPGTLAPWVLESRMRAQSGDPAGASRALARAVALAPRIPALALNLGAVRAQLGDFAGAAEAYSLALMHAPDSSAAHLGLADASAALGRNPDAAREYRAWLANPSGPADLRADVERRLAAVEHP